MSKAKAKHKAPVRKRSSLLSAIIILIMIHGAIFTALAYYDLSANNIQVKSLYMPILFLTSAADVVAGFAMWNWKKWGFQLYLISAFVAATAALMNTGSIMVLFASLVPTLAVAYIFIPKQHMFE